MIMIKKCFAVIITTVMIIGITSFASGTKSKTTYIQTKMHIYDKKEKIKYTTKFSYNKKKLLKRAYTRDASNEWKVNYKFKYNKKGQIKKQTNVYATILNDVYSLNYPKESMSFKYDKKGFLKKMIAYNDKGKCKKVYNYIRDKKGHPIVYKKCNSKGKAIVVYKYKNDYKSNYKKSTKVLKKGKLSKTVKFEKETDNKVVGYVYDAKGKLAGKTVSCFKEDLYTRYEEYEKKNNDWNLYYAEKYKLKKVKTSSGNKVKRQQLYLNDYLMY